jgi:fumarate reductase subunit D
MLLEDLKLNLRTARANRAGRSKHDTGRASVSRVRASAPWTEFRAWRRRRPFVGSVLLVLSGIEMFFSGQLDLGNIRVQVGIEGLQSTIIPIILVTLGLLSMFTPVHRIFYGVIALAVAVYSLIGLNLGGFFVGMLLGAVGGVIVVSWMPKVASADAPKDGIAKEPRPLVHGRL